MTDEIKVGDLVTITDVAPGCDNELDIGKIATICKYDDSGITPRYYTNLHGYYWHRDGFKKFADGVMPAGAFKVGDRALSRNKRQICVIQKIIIRNAVVNHNITLDDISYICGNDSWRWYEKFKHNDLVKAEELKISVDNALSLI